MIVLGELLNGWVYEVKAEFSGQPVESEVVRASRKPSDDDPQSCARRHPGDRAGDARFGGMGLGAPFYDAQEIASATEKITIPDVQLIDDGTFFVVEEEGRVVACGGWSKRKKLYTGSVTQANLDGLLDPDVDAARIRAMFVDPAFARRGLGRLILESSEEDARRAGFQAVRVDGDTPGVPLYAGLRLRRGGAGDARSADGMRLGAIRMRKR
jgi:GNAT superfamily N-acetyltransferase